MAVKDSKSILPYFIYRVLEEHSDINHKLTQQEILDYLKKEYQIDAERKAIGRNIQAMRNILGNEIQGERGVYLNRQTFEESEMRLVVDSIMSNRYISEFAAKSISSRLGKLMGPSFPTTYDEFIRIGRESRRDNDRFFETINVITNAIKRGDAVRFRAYHNVDGNRILSDGISRRPKCLIIMNQRYYMYCEKTKWDLHWPYYAVDDIETIRCIESRKDQKKTRGLTEEEKKLFRRLIASNVPSDIEVHQISFYVPHQLSQEIEKVFGGGMDTVIRNLKPEELAELREKYPNSDADTQVVVLSNDKIFKRFYKQNLSKVIVNTPKRCGDWLKLELQNGVKLLESESNTPTFTDKDEELLDGLSIGAKVALGVPVFIANVEWKAIDIRSDRIQFISKNTLDYTKAGVLEVSKDGDDIMISRKKTLWKGSDLRNFLNGEFYDKTFSKEEKSMILTDENGDMVQLPHVERIRDVNYSCNNKVVDMNALAESKWKKEKETDLGIGKIDCFKENSMELHEMKRRCYWGLDGERDDRSIVALSMRKPYRVNRIEMESICVRPTIWVKTSV